LICADNFLTSLPELPETLINIFCYGNQLQTLPELPDALERLHCFNNELVKLPELPKLLTHLNCTSNHLENLPKLPEKLYSLFCSCNNLQTLHGLPENLVELQRVENPLVFISPLPKRPESYQVPGLFYISHSEENYSIYRKRYQTYKYMISFLVLESNLMSVLLTNRHFWFPGEGEDWEEKLFEAGGYKGWED